MSVIKSENIKNAVKELCLRANTVLPDFTYSALSNSFLASDDKDYLSGILKNAQIAAEYKRPICQDTGQIVVFVEIGQDVHIDGELLSISVNKGVSEAYQEFFLRKSVVKNAVFDRVNTENNTPCVIYTDIVYGDKINLTVLPKGAGSENNSASIMLSPTSDLDEIYQSIKNIILKGIKNSCPPIFVGVGIGGTLDYSAVLSKKALFCDAFTGEEIKFSKEIVQKLNKDIKIEGLDTPVLRVNLKTAHTHIACMPLSVTINCHANRHSSCSVSELGVEFHDKKYDFIPVDLNYNYKKIDSSNIDEIKKLQIGEKIVLSGRIYTMRDAAHQRIADLISNSKELPFDIKNKIIFYAGPCPARKNEIIGPVGPTTSVRMDKFSELMYQNGVLATIGKGERTSQTKDIIEDAGAVHFSMQGGLASLYASCITKNKVIAFEELGPEAVYELEVENLPLTVSIIGNKMH